METDREFQSAVELPHFPGTSVVTRRNASPDPNEATAETVALMREAAMSDSISPPVWVATKQALDGCAPGRQATAEAIYRWTARNIKYRSDDPVLKAVLGLDNELDLLIRPARLLTMRRPSEDCDGFTMLACAMLLCAGVPCEIVTIKADHEDPTRFSHVYCQVPLENGEALVMDCSQGAQHGFPCGWEAPGYFDKRTWGLMQPQQKKGLQGLGYCDLMDCDMGTGPASSGGGSSIDLNSILQSVVQGAIQIGKQVTLPAGSYVANAGGVMANQVPGAVPGYNVGASAYTQGLGISSTTLLIGGGLLALALIAGKKK